MFSKKYFICGVIIGCILLFTYIFSLPDGKLHIVYCDVGQGDASYIRLPSNQDILIDGGPNDKVLTCLGRHMPFYDRTIDLVLLSHPQADHLTGLLSVVQRFDIGTFIIGVEGNDTKGYKTLVDLIKSKNIPIKNMYQNDQLRIGKVQFDILWPERKWIAGRIQNSRLIGGQADGNQNVGSAVLGLSTDTNVNDFSYYALLTYGNFKALFPGDGDSLIQPEIDKTTLIPNITVLKYPHHGSKTAILPEFLKQLSPKLAIISVGKNSYGHPSQIALDLLHSVGAQVKRTDQSGDIEVVSDGVNWTVH
jgi:competence protein ComEC